MTRMMIDSEATQSRVQQVGTLQRETRTGRNGVAQGTELRGHCSPHNIFVFEELYWLRGAITRFLWDCKEVFCRFRLSLNTCIVDRTRAFRESTMTGKCR